MSKSPFKPDEIVVAVEAFSMQVTPDLGGDILVTRGMRLRATHVAVQRIPQYFLPDGSSEEDLTKRRSDIARSREEADTRAADARAAALAPVQARPIADEDKRLCIRQSGMVGAMVKSISADGEPLGCQVGDILSKNHGIVRANPHNFIAVVPDGLRAEDAVVAMTDLTQHQRDGSKRVVYRGQWLRSDDPLVAIHWQSFERAPRPVLRVGA